MAARAMEELGFDPDVRVLWQRKALADTDLNVRWADQCLMEVIEDLQGDEGEDVLLLCDNLNSQVAGEFKAAIKNLGATLEFGPKSATHLWQPVDHHVGARYKYLMARSYDEWMVNEFHTFEAGKVSAEKRRQLLTQWCGDAYRQLEKEREEREKKIAEGAPDAERSLFYRAFQRTGCLVTRDGTGDDDIKPNQQVSGERLEKFYAALRTPSQLTSDVAAAAAPLESFWITAQSSSESSSLAESSEDLDDEPADDDSSGDDGEREPLDNSMLLEVASEAEQIRAHKQRVVEGGDEIELGDFNMARRIANQFSSVAFGGELLEAAPTRSGRQRKATHLSTGGM